jgi:hypothetical protein
MKTEEIMQAVKPVDQTKYPYTLDAPLKEAIKQALDAGDNLTVKRLWTVFTSYRKSK